MATRTRKLVAASSTYLDPLHCDSTINYKVIEGSRDPYGMMQLADCEDKITWYFYKKSGLAKIKRAIAALQDLEATLELTFAKPKPVRKKVTKKVK